MREKAYTAKQGQYLAFIFYFTKIHRFPPADSDMQNYFKVSPPSAHQIVLTLEANGFINGDRAWVARFIYSFRLAELPELE